MSRSTEAVDDPRRASAEVLRQRLVPWFEQVARDLPWRGDVSPWQTLMSELMLQQTRVETVVPYFERFTARWPTVQDFAAASEEAVLEAWAGLGYYRRARALHAAARAAAERGGLPDTVEELKALPGVGDYTAGAVASIAFGRPAAAVDGNVERVISRVDLRREDPKKAVGRRALAARVHEIQHADAASEITQGLMELGATVCTPRSPSCGVCPWADLCLARADGVAEELPVRPKRRPPKPVLGVAGLLWRGSTVLMGRRPPGLLGGLWEPVMAEHPPEDEPHEVVGRAFAERAGVEVRVGGLLDEVVHVFTHRRLTLRVYGVEAASDARIRGDGSYEELAFLDPRAPGVGLSKLARKALAARDAQAVLPVAADGER